MVGDQGGNGRVLGSWLPWVRDFVVCLGISMPLSRPQFPSLISSLIFGVHSFSLPRNIIEGEGFEMQREGRFQQ